MSKLLLLLGLACLVFFGVLAIAYVLQCISFERIIEFISIRRM